jgi:hypothetical protein
MISYIDTSNLLSKILNKLESNIENIKDILSVSKKSSGQIALANDGD